MRQWKTWDNETIYETIKHKIYNIEKFEFKKLD